MAAVVGATVANVFEASSRHARPAPVVSSPSLAATPSLHTPPTLTAAICADLRGAIRQTELAAGRVVLRVALEGVKAVAVQLAQHIVVPFVLFVQLFAASAYVRRILGTHPIRRDGSSEQ